MIHQKAALAAKTVGSFYSILITIVMGIYLLREVFIQERERWRKK